MREDWLVGKDRHAEARERILTAASELVSRQGFEAFTIDALAARVHCSPATIYRHAGGKAAIREAVAVRASARIVETVRDAIKGLDGRDRVVMAVAVALRRIRSEPLGPWMMGAIRPDHDGEWLTESPMVSHVAKEIIGRADLEAAQWLIRITMALWYWPVKDPEAEYQLVKRFVGPSLFEQG